ncbi:hypothetical protein K505DRAFT_421919 [Melanomma pulvis-pyrius CBS 109.77]|uniref:BTB domain-containing protein n=1 Tax=Melanomma pulvis-pyrius CBS 109.77 TaxID=1314802 RepID=A0A6A6WTX2_9PLEO|nr:hypothetical protein K505DRAFT_421919 [Melanomma pulvis-pyrius CBS 109.77]
MDNSLSTRIKNEEHDGTMPNVARNPSVEGTSSTSASVTVRIPTPDEPATIIVTLSDLRLVVSSPSGLETQTFEVQSACIRLASPKWAALVDLPATSIVQGKRSIEIEEEHADVIEAVLCACHLQHVDSQIGLENFESLVKVAQVCNRHEVTAALRPYIREWVHAWLPTLHKPSYEMWLLVAYVFGYRDVFQCASEHVALNMSLSDEGYNVAHNEATFSLEVLPRPILDNLVRIRTAHITDTLSACYGFVDTLLDSSFSICSRKCRSMALGSFSIGLTDNGLWPERARPDDVKMSVNHFRATLLQIEIIKQQDLCPAIRCEELTIHFDLPTIERDSELETHFKTLQYQLQSPELLAWEHVAISELGYLPRDFYQLDSDSIDDTDYDEDETDPSEPEEEFTDYEGDVSE